jgi:predicted phage baseplate assembly protein
VPQITLRVDGIEWRHVDRFYGLGPADQVYRIEMAPDGTATVVGGDGLSGRRFPSGLRNIVASYRHGAGAAKPPPGSITQFARAAAGLSRVSQPLEAWGGADAETATEIRTLAPTGALTLGRAVSLADFEAMIRSSSGVLNASVAYSWDQGLQTAVVTAWIIADSGDPSATLAGWLAARAVPGLAIRIGLATRIEVPVFDVSVTVAPDHAPDTVRAGVRLALFDPVTGFLAPRNVPIAAPLFRSHLIAAIHAVPGVAAVLSITLAAGPMPKALLPGAGAWFDFLAHGQVL